MKLLDASQIKQKIKRLAYEILEQNFGEKEIILAGINNKGHRIAFLLKEELDKISSKTKIILTTLSISPANPLEKEIKIGVANEQLQGKVIIIVDDVANTGRTLYYSIKPMLEILPKKVEFAVLVDRQHKSFPIKVDYVGLALATTLKENIEVDISTKGAASVMLN